MLIVMFSLLSSPLFIQPCGKVHRTGDASLRSMHRRNRLIPWLLSIGILSQRRRSRPSKYVFISTSPHALPLLIFLICFLSGGEQGTLLS